MFGLSFEEEQALHAWVVQSILYASIPIFLLLQFVVRSPWGKTYSSQWWLGPAFPAKISWFVFEVQNLFWASYCFHHSEASSLELPNAILLAMFTTHYIQRGIIYPIRMSRRSKPMPLLTSSCAFLFCTCNGYAQSQGLCNFRIYEQEDYATSIRFLSGVLLFFIGMAINLQSDGILRSLRSDSGAYKIPYGGLFPYISAPHYFGEILEWTGYAISADSNFGYAFLIYTMSNLIPRCISHHEWYLNRFKDYPRERKAVIPFAW